MVTHGSSLADAAGGGGAGALIGLTDGHARQLIS